MEPISPHDVQNKKNSQIPDVIIRVFNEMIVEKWDGSSATLIKNEVVQRILIAAPHFSEGLIYGNGWLDVEPLFRNKGWAVYYDKPGYNESYPATYKFSKPTGWAAF